MWSYRVFSCLWTEPDVEKSGRRYLTFRRVWWKTVPVSYPLPEDIFAIGRKDVVPAGHTTEEVEVELERMKQALDEPVMILAEWLQKVEREIRS